MDQCRKSTYPLPVISVRTITGGQNNAAVWIDLTQNPNMQFHDEI